MDDQTKGLIDEVEELKKPKKNKGGRPKGSFTRKFPRIKELMATTELTREEKLLLLSQIARSGNANASDIIKAIQAHSEAVGETAQGLHKLVISVELADDIKKENKNV